MCVGAFLRFQGAFSAGGPIWRMDLADGPRFPEGADVSATPDANQPREKQDSNGAKEPKESKERKEGK